MEIISTDNELDWRPHPIAKGVRIKVLVSRRKHGVDVTCMLVRIGRGMEVPVHVHDEQKDIIYVLSGEFKIWIDGIDEFDVNEGTIIRVPIGTKHRIYNVRKDTLLYDVFNPAIV